MLLQKTELSVALTQILKRPGGATGNKAHAVNELRHQGLYVYPFAAPCPNTANEPIALCFCVIRHVPPLYALPGNNGVFMWKDQQLFFHRAPQAVTPCRRVPLAVSCRHQDLECRTQGFSMGETKLFEHPWNSYPGRQEWQQRKEHIAWRAGMLIRALPHQLGGL